MVQLLFLIYQIPQWKDLLISFTIQYKFGIIRFLLKSAMIMQKLGKDLPRILIVGAGPSGLSFLRAIKVLQQKENKKLANIQCYQLQQDWSGQWNYQWRTGLNKYGQTVPNSMYMGLWTNVPKQFFEFPDYSCFQHFGCNVSSFLTRQVFRDYLVGRFNKANIKQFIRFQTAVRYVQYLQDKQKFTAVIHDLKEDKDIHAEYDYVVVATGHYSVPFSPYYKGFETFPGRILHAHDLRQWNSFKERRVLVVGGSLSAEDVACQCYKYGSSHVTISYHRVPIKYVWPEKMDCRPCLKEVQSNKVIFKDGSEAQYDAIILCTGYQHHYPFLADDLKLKTKTSFYPPLYMGVVFEANPNVFYIGAQNQVFSLMMFDLQAYYVRDLILGRSQLPSIEQMKKDTKMRKTQEENIKSFQMLFDFAQKYMQDLLTKSDYPKWNIPQSLQILKQTIALKRKNILTYRDSVHKSVITGVVSSRHPKKWLEQFDDSYNGFMSHFIKPKI